MDSITIIQNASETFLHSYFFAALKIFLGVYVVVLLIDIILLLSFRNLRNEMRQGKLGSEFVPSVPASVMKKQWSKIESRLQSGSVSEYKVAILEADNIIEKVLADTGHTGEDMAQKIEQLRMTQPDDAELLDGVHQIRNRIVFEQDFHLDFEQTEKALAVYKEYLKKFDYFG